MCGGMGGEVVGMEERGGGEVGKVVGMGEDKKMVIGCVEDKVVIK